MRPLQNRYSPPSVSPPRKADSPADRRQSVARPDIPFESEHISALFDHWLSLWSPGNIPRRKSIDPTAFPRSLPYIWIYRLLYDGDFNCVLSGEEINAAWGRNIKGMSSREIIGVEYDTTHPRWLAVINYPAILYLSQLELGLPKRSERIALPLADDDGVIRSIIGLSIYTSHYGAWDDSPCVRPGTVQFWDARTLRSLDGFIV